MESFPRKHVPMKMGMGIHLYLMDGFDNRLWIPAFAGMTKGRRGNDGFSEGYRELNVAHIYNVGE